ncbi:Thiol-disulfide oxidoreductase ResA [bioreactor metagenome]|uniref:Thiol-disulfide oxidoreductase ResA n=1 Tax=bioreactor metagenome TaxID=1076179 RepID=A0A644VQ68_9ZZZZ
MGRYISVLLPVLIMTKPVLYDFFATWCGPCRLQSPIVHDLAKKLGDKVDVQMIDVDEHGDLANKYSISVVPTLIIEKDGKVIQRLEGVTDAATLESLLLALI